MTRSFGQLYVAIDCTNCGKHGLGVPEGGNVLRCDDCGRFGSEAKEYCSGHDLDYEGLYPEDNHCPYCREEQRQRDALQHEMTRDPTLEPW